MFRTFIKNLFFCEFLLSLAAFELLINRQKAFETRRDKGILKATLHLRIIMVNAIVNDQLYKFEHKKPKVSREKRESET